MTSDLLNSVKHAIEKRKLNEAYELLIRVLGEGTADKNCELLLGQLAFQFKQEGLLESAVELLERKLALTADPGDSTVKKLWIKELDQIGWFMSRKDSRRTSYVIRGSQNQQITFQQSWRKSFPDGQVTGDFLLDAPSPIIARDMLITFNSSLNAFIGLDLFSGNIHWRSGVLAERLYYSSTPLYIRPWLVFVTPPSIKRISMYDPANSMEILVSSEDVKMVQFSAPSQWNEILLFPLARHLYIYNLQENRGDFYSVPLQEDEILRSPVVCKNEVFLITNFGTIYRLPKDVNHLRLECVRRSPSDPGAVYSAPCVIGDTLVFEAVNRQGYREICSYTPSINQYLSIGLRNESCNIRHTHLNFPPIATSDGCWLVSSDTHPRFYLVCREAQSLVSILLNIQHRIPPEFSVAVGSYLISKALGGFLHVNLVDSTVSIEIFQPHQWEIISQPIVYGKRILFVCKEGVICYEMQ